MRVAFNSPGGCGNELSGKAMEGSLLRIYAGCYISARISSRPWCLVNACFALLLRPCV